jgi:hypothetical protein
MKAVQRLAVEDRGFVNEFVGLHAATEVRDYLRDFAEVHHATANRLGAEPTNFWGQAAESTESASDASGATVTIHSPGIGRVDHDVDIYPTGGKQWLTIPANAAAYGNRYLVGTAERARFDKDGNLLPPKNPGAPLYVFVKQAHLKQDRALLPSDDALMAAAIEGADEGISLLMQKAERQTTPA